MNGEVKIATVQLNPTGRIDVTCPHCGWVIPRTKSYIHTLHFSFRCNRCQQLYRVPFTGEKSVKK
jgi:uncharacterized C2H2 Zn-finger protein